MSVFNGFCTRKQEEMYNTLVSKLIDILSKFVFKTINNCNLALTSTN